MNKRDRVAKVAELLERTLRRARSVGGVTHPGVNAAIDELLAHLQPITAEGELVLELAGPRVLHAAQEVWVAPDDEPPVLASTHRDGVRVLVFTSAATAGDLRGLVEALARAARRSKAAKFTAVTQLEEHVYQGVRWATDDRVFRGAVPEAGGGSPEGWFIGEPLPRPDPDEVEAVARHRKSR